MERLKAIINAKFRVEKRLDDLHHPCGFDVVRTLPEGHNPEHDEYICSLPDGMSQQQEMIAGMIAAAPELRESLDEALELIHDLCFGGCATVSDEECEKASAMLKKGYAALDKARMKNSTPSTPSIPSEKQ